MLPFWEPGLMSSLEGFERAVCEKFGR
jgi:hypothetical protein